MTARFTIGDTHTVTSEPHESPTEVETAYIAELTASGHEMISTEENDHTHYRCMGCKKTVRVYTQEFIKRASMREIYSDIELGGQCDSRQMNVIGGEE